MIVVIAATLGGGDDNGGGTRGGSTPAGQVSQGGEGEQSAPRVYVVQNGDTLTSIAHQTGVPVAVIVRLNPGVDPQILISGEKLKLR